jgi:hypothetical protein
MRKLGKYFAVADEGGHQSDDISSFIYILLRRRLRVKGTARHKTPMLLGMISVCRFENSISGSSSVFDYSFFFSLHQKRKFLNLKKKSLTINNKPSGECFSKDQINIEKKGKIKDCSSFRVGLGERRSRVIFIYVADLAVEMILAKWGRHPTQIRPPPPKIILLL